MELEVINAVFPAIFRFEDKRKLGLFTYSNVCWEPGEDHNEKKVKKEGNDFTTECNVGGTEDNEVFNSCGIHRIG